MMPSKKVPRDCNILCHTHVLASSACARINICTGGQETRAKPFARLPPVYTENPMNFALPYHRRFFYLMGDGSTKILSCYLVADATLQCVADGTFGPGFWDDVQSKADTVKVLDSIMRISALRTEGANRMDELITFAARQNSAAQTQPLSPFQWAMMMRADNTESINEFVEQYNSHPTINA